MKAKIAKATVRLEAAVIARITRAERDLKAAAGVAEFVWIPDSTESLEVEFVDDAPSAGAPA